jgi:hypothetical protein
MHVFEFFWLITSYVVIFLVKLVYLIPAFCGFTLLRFWRWLARGSKIARASNWQSTDALVDSSFEMDESTKRIRNLLANLFIGSLYDGPRQSFMLARGMPEMVDIYDDNNGNDNSNPWIVGIRYSYAVGDEAYGGTYLLPKAYVNSGEAGCAAQEWVGKDIRVRYNPDKPEQSFFLVEDGAPGKPRIPAGWATEPLLTSLSLSQSGAAAHGKSRKANC